MFWALPLGMAALGAIQGENRRKAEQDMNMAEAEKTRYSPWTGMQGQIRKSGNGWMSGAMQGGLTGAMLGQSMGLEGAAGTPGLGEFSGGSASSVDAVGNRMASRALSTGTSGAGMGAMSAAPVAAPIQKMSRMPAAAPMQMPQAPGYLSANNPFADQNPWDINKLARKPF